MSTLKYYRKGATIRTIKTGADETYFDPRDQSQPSINAAKRASRKLQSEHGPGSLQVVQKLPQVEVN